MSGSSSSLYGGSSGISNVYELSTLPTHTVGATATVTDLALATTSVVLPPASPANRVITIRNPNPAVVTSSLYKNMQGVAVTSIAENTSLTLISTGTTWVEFSDADFADRWAWGTPTQPTETTTGTTGRTGNTAFGFNNPLHTADVGGSLGLNLAKVATPTTTIASGAGSPTIVYLNTNSLQTVTLASASQTRRVLYFVNNNSVAKVISPYLGLDGTTRTDIPPFSALMLQNTLTEWREVMSTKLQSTFDATVNFSTVMPTTAGVVFTPNTPASTNVIYVSSVDGSQWTYNGTNYVIAPVSNDWKLTGNAGSVEATNFIGTTDNVGLSFRTNNVIRQTITNTGNIGIGTIAPSALLHVNGTATFAGATTFAGGATAALNSGGTWITMPSTGLSGIGTSTAIWAANVVNTSNYFTGALAGDTAYRNTSGKLLFGNTSGAPAMAITGNNVGIGTITPTQKLHVIGNILATGTITPSDKRLKKNIKEIVYGLKDLLKITAVSYTKKFSLDKAEKGEVKEFGFIAQDLQKVMPELVVEGTDKDKILAVNYTSIIPVLVKAIQEQQQQIDDLNAKIKAKALP